MKKVLSTVAALGLVAGLASTASAVEFKMSGKYLVEGAYSSNAEGVGALPAVDENTSDSYYLHTFEIKPSMKVNDKITMGATIRLADDTFWGNKDDTAATGANVGPVSGDMYVHHLYMDYASPIGKIRVGRVPAGPYGPDFRNPDKRENRVMWYPSFLASGPWSTLLYTAKASDNDVVANTQTDQDSDKYVARVYYKTDSLDSGVHYGYYNNKTGTTTLLGVGTATDSDAKQELSAYASYKMDNYFVNAELTHFFGDVDWTAGGSNDYDAWAGMLQVGVKLDALTPSLMYFYAQGQDANSDDMEAALVGSSAADSGTGDLFEPLYILTGRHTGMLNTDLFSNNTGNMSTAGVHAIIAAADYAVSNQLTLHGAIAYAKADEKVNTAVVTLEDDYGWEYNVGAAYKLLDNLTYEAHFGYLDTGDYFKYDNAAADPENIYIMTHSLTMTF